MALADPLAIAFSYSRHISLANDHTQHFTCASLRMICALLLMRLAGDVREESSGVITILREIRLSLRQDSGFIQAATAAFKSSCDRN